MLGFIAAFVKVRGRLSNREQGNGDGLRLCKARSGAEESTEFPCSADEAGALARVEVVAGERWVVQDGLCNIHGVRYEYRILRADIRDTDERRCEIDEA